MRTVGLEAEREADEGWRLRERLIRMVGLEAEREADEDGRAGRAGG